MGNEETILALLRDINTSQQHISGEIGFVKATTNDNKEALAIALNRLNNMEANGCPPGQIVAERVGVLEGKFSKLIIILVAVMASAGGLGGIVKLLESI